MSYDARIEKTITSIKNHCRIDFTYNIFHHPKGKWFQFVLKPVMLKLIAWMHRKIEREYDKDAYVFDDNRLKILKAFLYQQGNNRFSYHQKYGRMHYRQSVDILLFLLKEDIYYRARFFEILNDVSKLQFELDEYEKNNIKVWI